MIQICLSKNIKELNNFNYYYIYNKQTKDGKNTKEINNNIEK